MVLLAVSPATISMVCISCPSGRTGWSPTAKPLTSSSQPVHAYLGELWFLIWEHGTLDEKAPKKHITQNPCAKKNAPLTTLVQKKPQHSKSLCKKNRITQNPCVKKTAALKILVQTKPHHSKSLCKQNRITQNPCVKKTAALKILVQKKPHHSQPLFKKNRSTQNPCAKKKPHHSKPLCKKTASLKILVQ